jgi:acetate kinase
MMHPEQSCILTINAGSSGIKFTLYQTNGALKRLLHGNIDRIGLPDSKLTFIDEKQNREGSLDLEVQNHNTAANFLIDWLQKQVCFSSINGIGHRVVHGMNRTGPEIITPELLHELHGIMPYDPEHLPAEIELIKVFCERLPNLSQVACFDTSFHQTMPRVAKMLPIPRRFDTMGIQRYGFHGLSYAYLMEELAIVADDKAAKGRVILAHLGSGASMAAVFEGKSMDTSMGFTPAAGLPMSTRTGDLDPGVAWYMMRSENLTPKQFNYMINHESGLLGISETSSDMKDLLALEKNDFRAAEAVSLFCYQARKWIGSFAAALGGLDTLVFSGGIGENSPEIRARICEGLDFIGISLDDKRNLANAPVISSYSRQKTVRIIHTDEEWMIAKMVNQTIFHNN